MTNRFIIFSILFFNITCTRIKEQSKNEMELINISVNPELIENEEPLKSFIENISYLYIITPLDIPIGGVEELIVTSDRLYLRSGMTFSTIFTMSRNGDFLSALQKEGKGPGEYSYVQSIFTGNHKDLYIFDIGNQKVIQYDSLSSFKSEWKHGQYGQQMVKYQDLFILNTGYSGSNNSGFFNLIVFDKDFKLLNRYLPYNEKLARFISFGDPLSLSFYKQNLFFTQFISDTIYQITSNQIYPRFFVDFGKYRMQNDDYTKNYRHSGEFFDELNRKNRAFWIRNVLITDRYLFFMYVFNSNERFVIYDKKDQNIIHVKGFTNNIDFIQWNNEPIEWPLAVFENKIYSFIEPADFIVSINELKSRLPSTAWKEFVEQHQDIINIYNKIDKNSNPILRICTLKK